jgi:hypothetical protein
MGVMQVLPIKDDQILSQLQQFQDALKKVEEIYGMTPKSSDEALHRLHDQTIAESLKLNNVPLRPLLNSGHFLCKNRSAGGANVTEQVFT